ncbi:translation initiation factor IF-2 [Anaplasmataceae bacterium AB001_6]|nr:translation initiation factor IF-2 [Anaplasmataceae bacterium AB001_6]
MYKNKKDYGDIDRNIKSEKEKINLKLRKTRENLKLNISPSVDMSKIHEKFLRNIKGNKNVASNIENNDSVNSSDLTDYERIVRQDAVRAFGNSSIVVNDTTDVEKDNFTDLQKEELFESKKGIVEQNNTDSLDENCKLKIDDFLTENLSKKDSNSSSENLIEEKIVFDDNIGATEDKLDKEDRKSQNIVDDKKDIIESVILKPSDPKKYEDEVIVKKDTSFAKNRFTKKKKIFDKPVFNKIERKKRSLKLRDRSVACNLPDVLDINIRDSDIGIPIRTFSAIFSVSIDYLRKIYASLEENFDENSTISEHMISIIAEEIGQKINFIYPESELDKFYKMREGTLKDLRCKAPIVTVMGHVDHGKTTLLDSLRDSSIVLGESGNITQHIGAYRVFSKNNDGYVTFIDTPGHQSFTAMRIRGANFTDIVVLVVAADDGVKEQTIEAINHARSAKVPIIVAVNKIDKDSLNVERVFSELAQNDVIVEKYGGEVIAVEISAKNKINLDVLLENIFLQSEMLNKKVFHKGLAKAIILESKVKIGLGIVATVIIMEGELRLGDAFLVSKNDYGKIKNIFDCKGKRIKNAVVSQPVEISGFNSLPNPGDYIFSCKNEKQAKMIINDCKDLADNQTFGKMLSQNTDKRSEEVTFDDLFSEDIKSSNQEINLVIKADTLGSLEALIDSINELVEKNSVSLTIIHKGIGNIGKSDIDLAIASNSTVISFRVKSDKCDYSNNDKVKIVTKDVIYDVIDFIQELISGNKDDNTDSNEIIGTAEIREIFDIDKQGKVAGSFIRSGFVKVGNHVKIYRDSEIIFESKVINIRHFKDSVKEIKSGHECGILLEGKPEISVGDVLEFLSLNKN